MTGLVLQSHRPTIHKMDKPSIHKTNSKTRYLQAGLTIKKPFI